MAATRERVVVICAIVYGAFILVAVAPGYLFSFQVSQPLLYRIGTGAYALTLLPAALVGLIARRICAVWLLGIAVLALFGLWQEEIIRYKSGTLTSLVLSLAWWAFVASIPAIMGLSILKLEATV